MLDLGNSFRASVERDPDALAIVDGPLRLTYAQWYRQHLGGRGGLRRARADAWRPSGDRAAEPLGGRDFALGLPVCRHCHHSGQLARQGRRNRLLRREFGSQGRGVRGDIGGGRARIGQCQGLPPHRARHDAGRRDRLRNAAPARGARRRAARRRRRLVGDALYLRHHGQAEGRAAPPARRTRRRASPMWRRTSTATANARSA